MKRKIKNFNDFLTCIKAGKKVTANDGKWLYYFENGCICCKHKEGYCLYNTTVEDEDLSRMEVEEQAPFTIEVGKFYRTRDGRKAYCFYKEEEDDLYPNHFVIDGESRYGIYTDDGLTLVEEEYDEDIVGYW